jgi:polysaccharide deacetylase 2 family uncharacterized protein YibQ
VAAPAEPVAPDAPPVTAPETAPDSAKQTAAAPQAPTAAATETAPGDETSAAPEPPLVATAAPQAQDGAATGAEAPQPPGAGDALPRPGDPAAAPAAPASDAAPAPQDAPRHEPLLEPAPIPAAAPDGGTAPAGAIAPVAPAASAEAAAPDLPQVLVPGGSEAPDAAPKPGMTATIQDDKPSTLPGVGRLTDQADGTTAGDRTSALPQIGKTEAAPAVASQGPMQAFAREFIPAEPQKPLFVILLRDLGNKGMARADLVKLPFPVSVVLDPLAPDVGEAMQAWRAAGQEVVMAMGGLPDGAEASDVAQTFQALTTSLPQAVAVIDANGATFQNDRPLATLVVPEIQAAGLGLVTFDEGLDAADQIARRGGVPSVQIFRRLDATGEGKPVIRRYLDRAAFKAAQDGEVVVLGDTRAETVAAILEWTVEGKASGVSLAPLTAALAR